LSVFAQLASLGQKAATSDCLYEWAIKTFIK